MQFTCATCGKLHEGLPCYGADRPDPYWDVPEDKREEDVFLTSDSCVIADRFFFVRGCIVVPVLGRTTTTPLSGVTLVRSSAGCAPHCLRTQRQRFT